MGARPRREYDKQLSYLMSEFESWKPLFKDITDYISPWAGRFLDSDTKPNDGAKRNSKILNSAASQDLWTLSSGLKAGLTSPSTPWIRLTTEDTELAKFEPVKLWLEDTTKRMLFAIGRSNFYDVVDSVYVDLGAYGTSAMHVDEDPRTVFRCYHYTLGEYYLATGPDGRVNRIYRVFWMTASSMISRFGKDKVSTSVQTAVTDNADAWFQVVHVLEENEDKKEGSAESRDKDYISVYYEYAYKEGDKLLSESGYDEFPTMVSRWKKTGSSVYAWSPGMDALGDVQMLQDMEAKGLRALEKWVDPPVNVPSAMKGKPVNLMRKGVNYVDMLTGGNGGISPIFHVPPDVDKLETKIARVKQNISNNFHVNLFATFLNDNSDRKTAFEISKMNAEKLSLLGPVVGRFHSEFIENFIERVFGIMDRNGLFVELPDELVGVDLEIEHISPLAQAQKAVETSTIEQFVGFVANTAQLKPNAVDMLDEDKAIEDYGEMIGIPQEISRSPEQVAAIREQKALAAAKEQQQQQASAMAQDAKTLSQADTGGDNALTRMVEQVQQ